jgi:diguanylate cyclase (GGDEF)-like protein
VSDPLFSLRNEYGEALYDYIKGMGEAASLRAYELGRQAMVSGLGLLDLAAIHTGALTTILAHPHPGRRSVQLLRTAADFYAEALSPFEMAHRGFIEANKSLRRLNETLEQRVAERTAALEHQTLHDLLTDLPNRNLLRDRLEQAILTSQRGGTSLGLVVLDLDAFKEVNDSLGHAVGDALLKEIGPRLRAAVRESDTVARLGGDEFALLLPGVDQAAATRLARKVLDSLESPFVIDGHSLDIGATIGIALYPDHGDSQDVLLRHAGMALSVAKRSTGGLTVYARDQGETAPRLGLAGQLRNAIQRDEFKLMYQLQVDFKTQRMTSAEALIRWHHPEQGIIPPGDFIPLAERRGLMKHLTQWVLDAALKQQLAWKDAGLDLPVAVNLSTRNLLDPELPETIAAALERWNLQPERLALEITESAIMSEPERATETVSSLRRMGMRLSIDDFGTGYSSLAYLHRLAVDEIKVDKSFVMAMPSDEQAATIVRATIDLGHALGVEVVAEGIENREVWDRLANLGCDRAQGYFISRPLPSADIERRFRESGGIFEPMAAAA